MAARITDIFPFLLITLLCVGVVEGGYQALEYFVLRPPVAETAVSEPVTIEKESPEKDEKKAQHDYRVILQRNLFGSPTEKEEPVSTDTSDYTEDIQPTSLNIVLMGTINGGEGVARAIILDRNTNKQELYEVGDVVQGALVKEILRGKVILVYNGKDEMLDMSEAGSVRTAFAAPAVRPGVGANRPVGPEGIGRAPSNQPTVSPRGTPRRVINRPRAIRPSRSIRTE
jgi:type II secretory pathway component PulC